MKADPALDETTAEHLILGAPDSLEQRRFLGRLLRLLAIGGAQVALTGIVPSLVGDPNAPAMQRVLLVVIGLLLVGLGAVAPSFSLRLGPRVWPPILAAGSLVGFLFPVALGSSYGPLAACAPVWIAGGSHTFLPPRMAWRWVAFALACWSVGMVSLGGPDVTGRILIAAGTACTVGYLFQQVRARLIAISTTERGARAAAEDAQAELEKASARKSAFLARVSHELRTPLNAVLGFAGMLHAGIAGPMTAKQDDYVEEVVTSGQHLLALVDDVLHLSRVETGDDSLSVASLDLSALVERSVALFRDQAACSELRLEVDLESGVMVEGDERKLRQVVFNLVSNAVRFTTEGGSLSVRLRREGLTAVLTVADTGVGIDPSDHRVIFEPFGQADGDGARGGTGLGLSVARRFVELHGGAIGVDSAVGRGATFTVRLPVQSARIASEHSVPSRSPRHADAPLLGAVGVQLLGDLAAALAFGAACTIAAVVVVAPPASGGSWLGPALSAVVLVVLAQVLHGRDLPAGFVSGGGHLLVGALTISVTVGMASAGTLGPVVTGAYAWVVLAAVVLLSRTAAILHGLGAAVTLAIVMATREGYTTAALRWELVCGMLTLFGVIVMPLVERMRELARSEAEARAAAERAVVATRAAARHKSEFVATMSHELRTPLNAIIGFSEALHGEVFGPLTPQQLDYLGEVVTSGGHLLALVNDVLDLAKLEAGRMPEPRSSIPLQSLVDDVGAGLARMGLGPPALVDADPDLPCVLGDRGALTRALVEMVAWVADRSPGPSTAARLVLLQSEGGVAVTASAPSTTRSDMSDAFEEFPPTLGRPRRGTGLGMALAQRQIQRHGGWCEAEATAGMVAVTAWLPVPMPDRGSTAWA